MAPKKGRNRGISTASDSARHSGEGVHDQKGSKVPNFMGRLAIEIVSKLVVDGVRATLGEIFGDIEFGPADDEDGGET